MGDTSIEWADKVWNPVSGCSKVSQGCKYCYAERIFHRPYPGRDFTDVRTHPERLRAPMSWTRPQRVFVNSMSDLFHESVPDEFIDQVFAVMGACQWLTFIVLTKRPQRMREWFAETWQVPPEASQRELYQARAEMVRSLGLVPPPFKLQTKPETRFDQVEAAFERLLIPDAERFWTAEGNSRFREGGWPLRNVILGVSAEDQATADERIPELLATPAACRAVSLEPLLGDVCLGSSLQLSPSTAFLMGRVTADMPDWTRFGSTRLDWVIVGGESGPHARPMHPDWVRAVRDECVGARVPFFFKQWGEWWEAASDVRDDETGGHRRVIVPSREAEDSFDPKTDCLVAADGRVFGSLDELPPMVPGRLMTRLGKKAAGRMLDGRTWDEVPA